MAEPKSIFDVIPDEAEEARVDAVADAEIAAVLGVPHSRVREWLGKGENVPPPTS